MSDSVFGFTSSFIVPTVISIAIGTTPITSGAVGRVLFEGTGNVVQESPNITWDDTNKIFKVSTGTNGIVIEGDAGGYPTLKINTLRSGTTRRNWMIATEQLNAGDFVLYRSSTGGGVANTLVYSIFNDGNFGLNTSVNAGYLADINGTMRVVNDATFNRIATFNSTVITGGTTTFSVRSNSNTQISVQENNILRLGAPGGAIIFNNVSFSPVSGTFFTFNYVPNNVLDTYAFLLQANYTNAGAGGPSEGSILRTAGSTATTTGIVTLNQIELKPTYNNTGGTTINRGLYYNPILTSITGTTNRAIETVTGDVLFGTTSGNVGIGTTTTTGSNLTTAASITAVSGGAKGISIFNTLVASANNDTLVGLDVQPAFTNGAFTGVTQFFGRFANSGGGTSLPATTGTSQTGGILRLGRDNAILDIGSNSAGGAWIQSANRTNLALNYNLFLNPNGGNILMGTTVDAGFKADVNGTMRVVGLFTGTGGATISGSNTTISTSKTFINNISTTISGFGDTGYGMAIDTGFRWGVNAGNSYKFGHWAGLNGAYNWNNFSASVIEVGMGATTPNVDNITWTSVNITPTFNANFSSRSGNIIRGIYYNPTITSLVNGIRNQLRAFESSFGGAYFNTTNVDGSAILQADSTTQGFLPPRMTTTQKNAITSPANGLVIFDTTLNKLCVYTTVWETVTSL
jgi:hypothetical protein